MQLLGRIFMKKIHNLISIVISLTIISLLSGCSGGGDSTTNPTINTNNTVNPNNGIVTLSLTDAPIDDVNVKGVYVTIDTLRYQYVDNNESWYDVDLNESRTINLLDLQDGNTTLLQQVELASGDISSVRFVLDPNECYVDLYVGGIQPLEVPNADTVGFNAIGGFTIEAGETVNITADFNVRKSVKVTENEEYELYPVIKMIDNSEIGEIQGTSNLNLPRGSSFVVVYAYEDGTWNENESNMTNNFNGAAFSANATDKSYTLPWLNSGIYDLVVVSYDENGVYKNILGFINDVSVVVDQTILQDITDETLLDALP
jgi:hypothetical protein